MKWTLLKLKAIAEDDDPLGREVGEVLWEERYNKDTLLDTKDLLGHEIFQAMYQQEPIEDSSELFHKEDLRYFENKEGEKINDLEIDKNQKYISVDPAFSKGEKADYTAIAVCGKNENDDLFLYNMIRERIVSGDHCNIITELADRFNIRDIYVEGEIFKNNLTAMVNSSKYNIQATKAIGSKKERANYFYSYIRRNKFYIKSNSPWIDKFIQEIEEFPNGRNDDQVDAMAYAAYIDVNFQNGNIFGTNYNPNKNKVIKGKFTRFD